MRHPTYNPVPMEPSDVLDWASRNRVTTCGDPAMLLARVNDARAMFGLPPFYHATIIGHTPLPAPHVGNHFQPAHVGPVTPMSERGRAGGLARAAKLSPERRREIAIKAGAASWKMGSAS